MVFENYYSTARHCGSSTACHGLVYLQLVRPQNLISISTAQHAAAYMTTWLTFCRARQGSFVRWRYARAAFRHFAYSIIDIFHIPRLTSDNMHEYVAEIHGLEYIEACRAEGRGGILVTVHMGSWELAGVGLGLLGVPITAVVLKHVDPRIDEVFSQVRQKGGMEEVSLGGALPKLEEAVKRGRFIALLADRDVKGTGMRTEFFGEVTTVPTGHAKLALSTGAWILPAVTYRAPDHRIIGEIRPPIIPDLELDTEEGLVVRCLRILEEFIREHPDQWSSFFNLWSRTELPVWQRYRRKRPG
jgi:KDO2-lipid IV(A) lauroyltransferase